MLAIYQIDSYSNTKNCMQLLTWPYLFQGQASAFHVPSLVTVSLFLSQCCAQGLQIKASETTSNTMLAIWWSYESYGFVWKCCVPKPNGFADQFPYKKLLFRWEYNTIFSDTAISSKILSSIRNTLMANQWRSTIGSEETSLKMSEGLFESGKIA